MSDINETEVTVEKNVDDEISLIDLFAVLLHWKWLIIIITALGMIGSVIVAIISLKLPPDKSFMPNVYTPEAQMLITEESSGGGMNLGSMASLASLAGVSIPSGGSSNSALATYLVNSNTILDAVVDKFNFIEEWEIKKSPRANSRTTLKKKLKSNFESDTGVFTLSFEDKDPALGCEVVNFVVDLLEQRFNELGVDKNKLQKANLEENINNAYQEILKYQTQIRDLEYRVSNVYSGSSASAIMTDTTLIKMELSVQEEIYKQLKAQYEGLKVTMASEKPVFQILEKAEIPDMKSGPSRGKMCIIVTFACGFISVFLAFLINALENLKKDPEAMAKLKGKK